mgnify:CR=1 FL=1
MDIQGNRLHAAIFAAFYNCKARKSVIDGQKKSMEKAFVNIFFQRLSVECFCYEWFKSSKFRAICNYCLHNANMGNAFINLFPKKKA